MQDKLILDGRMIIHNSLSDGNLENGAAAIDLSSADVRERAHTLSPRSSRGILSPGRVRERLQRQKHVSYQPELLNNNYAAASLAVAVDVYGGSNNSSGSSSPTLQPFQSASPQPRGRQRLFYATPPYMIRSSESGEDYSMQGGGSDIMDPSIAKVASSKSPTRATAATTTYSTHSPVLANTSGGVAHSESALPSPPVASAFGGPMFQINKPPALQLDSVGMGHPYYRGGGELGGGGGPFADNNGGASPSSTHSVSQPLPALPQLMVHQHRGGSKHHGVIAEPVECETCGNMYYKSCSTSLTGSISSLCTVSPEVRALSMEHMNHSSRNTNLNSLGLLSQGNFGSGMSLVSPALGTSGGGKVRTQRVRKSRWRKGKVIGHGSAGKVYLGLNDITAGLMAVKEVTISRADKHLKELYTEIQVMHQLRHKHIVAYLGAELIEEKGVLCIFQEWAPAGSLHQLLEHFGAMSESIVWKYTSQVLEGLAYLHANHVIHRDIKCRNILVDDQGNAKLADFGCALLLEHDSTDSMTMSIKGTPLFMAPEILLRRKSGRRVDVWSLGCVVTEMATTKAPWEDIFTHPIELISHFHSCEDPPPIPETLGDPLKAFLQRCFIFDPEKRPRSWELLHDPFIVNVPSSITDNNDDDNTSVGWGISGSSLQEDDEIMNRAGGGSSDVPLEELGKTAAMDRLRRACSSDYLRAMSNDGVGPSGGSGLTPTSSRGTPFGGTRFRRRRRTTSGLLRSQSDLVTDPTSSLFTASGGADMDSNGALSSRVRRRSQGFEIDYGEPVERTSIIGLPNGGGDNVVDIDIGADGSDYGFIGVKMQEQHVNPTVSARNSENRGLLTRDRRHSTGTCAARDMGLGVVEDTTSRHVNVPGLTLQENTILRRLIREGDSLGPDVRKLLGRENIDDVIKEENEDGDGEGSGPVGGTNNDSGKWTVNFAWDSANDIREDSMKAPVVDIDVGDGLDSEIEDHLHLSNVVPRKLFYDNQVEQQQLLEMLRKQAQTVKQEQKAEQEEERRGLERRSQQELQRQQEVQREVATPTDSTNTTPERQQRIGSLSSTSGTSEHKHSGVFTGILRRLSGLTAPSTSSSSRSTSPLR